MSKHQFIHSLKISANLSLFTFALLCIALGALLALNNPNAILLFFVRPVLFAVGAALLSFVAVPIVTIAIAYVRALIDSYLVGRRAKEQM